MELPAEVTRAYDWRGRFTGYRIATAFVPADPGNSDFQRIRSAIAAGACNELEPEIATAAKTFGARSELTGFDTNIGFVPNDPTNILFQILQKCISTGRSIVNEPAASEIEPEEAVEALIVCVLFQRPWFHLAGPFERHFPYRSSGRSDAVELIVRLRNVPTESPPSVVDLVLDTHGAHGVRFGALPLQAGVLEIEIPVERLQRLFRSEKPELAHDSEWGQFLEDQLAEHLVRSGRSKAQGPDRLWLITHAGYFLGRLVESLENTVIRTFTVEWGGVPPGHIRSGALHRHGVILARLASGQVRLQAGGFGSVHSFSLSGVWPDYGAAIQEVLNPEANALGHKKHVPARVRQMADAGFGMEAVSLLNAYLEVVVRDVLAGAVRRDAAASLAAQRIGHGARLQILRELNSANLEAPFNTSDFAEAVSLAWRIYERRNEYLHELELPEKETWLSVRAEREIDRLISAFTDPFEQMRRFNILAALFRADGRTSQFLADAVRRKTGQA